MFPLSILSAKQKLAAGGIVLAVAALVLGGAYGAGYLKGRADGKALLLKAAVAAYRERNRIDEKVDGLGADALCIELGGLPDECRRLRGLAQGSPAE